MNAVFRSSGEIVYREMKMFGRVGIKFSLTYPGVHIGLRVCYGLGLHAHSFIFSSISDAINRAYQLERVRITVTFLWKFFSVALVKLSTEKEI